MKTINIKKLVAIFASIAMIVTSVIALQMTAFADDVTYTFDEETGALVVSGTGAIDDYNEDTLESIPWYSNRSEIKSLVVGEGITAIGDYAFCREVNLTDVQLPSTLVEIGAAAFAGDSSLKELTVPDSVTSVGDYAFGFAYDMSLTEGFVAHCGKNSATQTYCIKSYVPFDVPFDASGVDTAVVLGSNWQAMWSIVPAATGTVDFWSVGGSDTYGLIYDSSDYVYNEKYFEMAKYAIKQHDDISSSNCNFHVTAKLEAGKRYYLAAKYMSASKTTGSFEVHMTFTCDEHDYVLDSNTATCTEPGVGSYTCSVCGAAKTEDTESLGHSYTSSTVDSTCTAVGTTTYTCTRCGDTYNEEVPMKEHTAGGEAVKENEVAPTCKEAGSYDMVTRCTVCKGIISSEHFDVNPIDHIAGEPKTTVVDPTCTEPGATITEIRCTMCEEILDQQITDIKDQLGHNYTSSTVEATCSAPGKTTYTCTRCEDTYDEDVPMKEHTAGEAVKENEVAPTCTKAGSYDMVTRCTVCKRVVATETTTIDPLGHSYTAIDFADGVVGAVCGRCDKYKTYTFMDYLNGTNPVLDIVEDGIVNAKDYAKFRREFPAPDVACDIDLTAGTVSRENATLADGVLTLTPAGRYSTFTLTGDTSDVKVVVNAANDVDIKLVNASLSVDSANAITINNTATDGTIPVVTISASEGTSNSITTTTTGNAISNYTDAIGACKLELKGHGTLTLNTASTAINSGAKIEIKNITLDITSGNRGIDTKYTTPDGLDDYASIDVEGNATITINSTDDGIRCKNFETKALEDGEVDSIINITAGGDGIQMEGKKSAFNSGNITINANGYAFNCASANFKTNAGSTINATGKKGYSKQ